MASATRISISRRLPFHIEQPPLVAMSAARHSLRSPSFAHSMFDWQACSIAAKRSIVMGYRRGTRNPHADRRRYLEVKCQKGGANELVVSTSQLFFAVGQGSSRCA